MAAQVSAQVNDLSGQGWIVLVSVLVSLWGAIGVVRVSLCHTSTREEIARLGQALRSA